MLYFLLRLLWSKGIIAVAAEVFPAAEFWSETAMRFGQEDPWFLFGQETSVCCGHERDFVPSRINVLQSSRTLSWSRNVSVLRARMRFCSFKN